jgi:hypothetical protein
MILKLFKQQSGASFTINCGNKVQYLSNLRIEKSAFNKLTSVVRSYYPVILRNLFYMTWRIFLFWTCKNSFWHFVLIPLVTDDWHSACCRQLDTTCSGICGGSGSCPVHCVVCMFNPNKLSSKLPTSLSMTKELSG